ncbi:MAG: MinD/ParA family protein [Deltaproteobacteria bacterium]|nr:MinD/ParA family protein [Deltaproteobacteria bacterium]
MSDQASGLRSLIDRRPSGVRLGNAQAVAVASGKGGVGKTFMAANLAVLAARAGRRVLLIDGDLGLANVDVALGLRCQHSIGEVLRGEVSLARAIEPGPCGVSVLAAGSGAEWLAHLDVGGLAVLQSELTNIGTAFDLIVIDCAAGIGRNVLFFAKVAGRVLLTLTPEPTALADAYALLKTLAADRSIDVQVVVNQALSTSDARNAYGRLRAVSGRFLAKEPCYVGHVPRDEDVRRSVRARQPVVTYSSDSRAACALDGIFRALLPPRASIALGGARGLAIPCVVGGAMASSSGAEAR